MLVLAVTRASNNREGRAFLASSPWETSGRFIVYIYIYLKNSGLNLRDVNCWGRFGVKTIKHI